MSIAAGELRHRIIIEQPTYQQDTQTGEQQVVWKVFASNIAAKIAPLSAREFVAAQATQSKVDTRITIRYRPGIRADMRIRHGHTIYNIHGVLTDPNSTREWITLPVSTGVNDG